MNCSPCRDSELGAESFREWIREDFNLAYSPYQDLMAIAQEYFGHLLSSEIFTLPCFVSTATLSLRLALVKLPPVPQL